MIAVAQHKIPAQAKQGSESDDDGTGILVDYFDKANHTADTWDDSDENFEHASSSSSLDETNLTENKHGTVNKTSGNYLESVKGADGYKDTNRSFDSSSESSFGAYEIYSETKDQQDAESRSVEDSVLKESAGTSLSQEKSKLYLNSQGNSELTNKNLSVDQKQFLELPKEEIEETDLLLCQYCLQDEKKKQAITYCMDCGLYMCSSCWRFHRKFVATRGHSVAFQQELIATEFDRYKPLTDEKMGKN